MTQQFMIHWAVTRSTVADTKKEDTYEQCGHRSQACSRYAFKNIIVHICNVYVNVLKKQLFIY